MNAGAQPLESEAHFVWAVVEPQCVLEMRVHVCAWLYVETERALQAPECGLEEAPSMVELSKAAASMPGSHRHRHQRQLVMSAMAHPSALASLLVKRGRSVLFSLECAALVLWRRLGVGLKAPLWAP